MSGPGEDEISYLPQSEEVTFCSSFSGYLVLKDFIERSRCGSAPESWCQAKIKLIPKSQDLSNPENFHPIALTSAISKLFNKILALQLERFLRNNDIIDTSLQKGFLTDSYQWHNRTYLCHFSLHPKCSSE